jgi:hypothetical protein
MSEVRYSTYHRLLRTSAVVVTVCLLFVSGLVSEVSKHMSQNAWQYVATSVGMHASVTPTELNQFTAALTAREAKLTERELAVAQREIAVELAETSEPTDYGTFLLAGILFILLVLIVLNYVLDFLRAADVRRNPI